MDMSHEDDSIRKSSTPRRTIVGGRPQQWDSTVKGLPMGIQKLLFGASLDEEFRQELLRDPVKAGDSIEVELTESEKAILSAVPKEQLQHMIEKMQITNIPRREFLLKSAATLAAVVSTAFGVGSLGYAGEQQQTGETPSPTPGKTPDKGRVYTRGITIDYPESNLLPYIDDALQEAGDRIVMAIFTRPASKKRTSGSQATPEADIPEEELQSEKFLAQIFDNESIRRLIRHYRMIPAKGYYMISPETFDVTVFPSVIFLTSDEEIIGRIERPRTMKEFTKIIQTTGEKYSKKTEDEP